MWKEKVFKYVWNVNSVLLLLFLLGFGGMALSSAISKLLRNKAPINTVNLAEDKQGIEKWRLGFPRGISGYDLYYLPLESENSEVDVVEKFSSAIVIRNNFSGYNGHSKAKNLIFINSKTNASHWLFSDNNQLIFSSSTIDFKVNNENLDTEQITKAISYRIAVKDTNGDKKVDSLDKRSFALSRPNGRDFVVILDGYDDIVTESINENGNYFVIYVKDADVYSMLIDLDALTIMSEQKLPQVPKEKTE